MVPKGWYLKSLCEIAEINPRKPDRPNDGLVSFIPMDAVSESATVLHLEDRCYEDVEKGFTSFKDKDVLVAKITPCFENGKGALVEGLTNGIGFGSTEFHVLRATPDASPSFIYYVTNTEQFRIKGEANMQGSAGQKRVTTDYLKILKILVPPISEQRKIAQILSTWDKTISTTERLLANKQQQKKALMQRLLTGKQRFAGFEGEWVQYPIRRFIVESRMAGSTGDTAKKITVKLYGQGVVAKIEKRVGSESTKYYSRRSGQFIYSKLDFLNGAFGIVPPELDGYESTLDLPAFDFQDCVDPNWFIYYVSREEFYTSQLGLANGGRKARRVNPSDLLDVQIPTPTLDEQKQIASILKSSDAEISLMQQRLDNLKKQKKALMQQLLTGKRRVKVDEAAA